MPLPLIPIVLGGASVLAAAFGVKKGVDAKKELDLAKSVNHDAKRLADRAEEMIVTAKEKTTREIEALGEQKLRILSGTVNDFVTTFEKIKNIQLNDSKGLDELKYFDSQSPEFLELKKVSMEAKKIAVNGVGALGGGVLLAVGTYNVVMGGLGGLLVTATTGTALSSLTGVAATNATLAWLGGGALSVGGFGMTGGAVVLGGLVVGPALALGGTLFAKQADKAYRNAQSNYEEAKTFEEQAKTIESMLTAIGKRAEQLRNVLSDLDRVFAGLNADMQTVIRDRGRNWNEYRETDKIRIYKCAQMAQVVKMVLDTSLLTEDGKLHEDSQKSLEAGETFLDSMNG